MYHNKKKNKFFKSNIKKTKITNCFVARFVKNWKILLRKIKNYVNVEVHMCMTAHFNITKISVFSNQDASSILIS